MNISEALVALELGHHVINKDENIILLSKAMHKPRGVFPITWNKIIFEFNPRNKHCRVWEVTQEDLFFEQYLIAERTNKCDNL